MTDRIGSARWLRARIFAAAAAVGLLAGCPLVGESGLVYQDEAALAGKAPPATALNPALAPSENFNLKHWKLTLPSGEEVSPRELNDRYSKPEVFYTDPETGGMVFRTPNHGGTTANSRYSRTELREMLAPENNSAKADENNWTTEDGGALHATLRVDRVSTTGDDGKVGRVVIGQIHGPSSEVVRLYFHKKPSESKGRIYAGMDTADNVNSWSPDIISNKDGGGIALGERFSYAIRLEGRILTVTIQPSKGPSHNFVKSIDPDYEGLNLYFKAGLYNQNNTGDADDYAQVTFFALAQSHGREANDDGGAKDGEDGSGDEASDGDAGSGEGSDSDSPGGDAPADGNDDGGNGGDDSSSGGSPGSAGLDPNAPPSKNFDLSQWKITLPSGSEVQCPELNQGYTSKNEFYTDPKTGGMVFRTPNKAGTTTNSKYSRSELREMLACNNSAKSDENNWTTDDGGTLTATLRVDRVSTTGDDSKLGRVVIGQIHGDSSEPIRLYYTKKPGEAKGRIYAGMDSVDNRNSYSPDIVSNKDGGGIALGEIFTYTIRLKGTTMSVTIEPQSGAAKTYVTSIDPGYKGMNLYFKAGVYNQNNTGEDSDYVQATFFRLTHTHP